MPNQTETVNLTKYVARVVHGMAITQTVHGFMDVTVPQPNVHRKLLTLFSKGVFTGILIRGTWPYVDMKIDQMEATYDAIKKGDTDVATSE